jgi:DNA-binding transcriptional MerR regulator
VGRGHSLADVSIAEEAESAELWKIGALATRTGLTVRALHHYDALGLCRPSRRTAGGHRLYTAEDVTRLYRVALLRRLGLRLDEIAAALDEPQWQLPTAMRRHLAEITERLDATSRLRARLAAMCEELDRDTGPSTDKLFATLEEMTVLDTPIRSTTSMLVYDNVAAAQDYLVRVFGLTAGPRDVDATGRVRHAEVRAGEQVVWLHPSGEEYRSPASLGATTGMTVVVVDDVDAHHARAAAAGAEVVEEPTDQDYGVREYGARDLEGHLWYFHASIG